VRHEKITTITALLKNERMKEVSYTSNTRTLTQFEIIPKEEHKGVLYTDKGVNKDS